MQILIIEDEPRAASQLQSLLKKADLEYQLLGIIDTVEDSILWFQNKQHPDLIFMDIQLADGLSFEIFQSVDIDVPIVFTTAFDQYAIQAFKVNSIDYLLKPIQQNDLDIALDKFAKTKNTSKVEPAILKRLLESIQVPAKRSGILVKSGAALIQIKIDELLYIYSEDSLTFGVTATSRYIIDETIDQLFNSLDQADFFRINRGQIVSKASIRKIEPYFNHRVKLTIVNPKGLEFIVSRQKTADFKDWLNR